MRIRASKHGSDDNRAAGGGEHRRGAQERADTLIKRADQALCAAKCGIRNQVVALE